MSSNEEEPNWDKLLNEAQFVALKISDPKATAKTPLTHSKLTSTAKLNYFSPGDNIDSPGLLDTSKDNPDNFLVKLTPESSPTRASNKEPSLCSTSPGANQEIY